MSTADQITPGCWVRFPSWEQWRRVTAARHTPFDPSEPRTTGFVQYDAPGFGGYAEHTWPCRIVTVTPEVVAA